MIENLTQSINSFIRPLGLSLSNSEQILTKVAVASFAIAVFANLSSVEADIEDNNIPTGDIYDFSANSISLCKERCKVWERAGPFARNVLNTCLFYCDNPR
ncbi:MAG: hypothetical protein ACRDDW_03050 [Candidatus Rhabdochlamydia sp.]